MVEFDQGQLYDELGRKYERGDAVAQSDAEAARWYEPMATPMRGSASGFSTSMAVM